MFFYFILFLFASNNENLQGEKNGKCKKDKEECVCDDCYGKYKKMWKQEDKEWRSKINSLGEKRGNEEEKRKQQQANEGWVGWMVRKFFGMFLDSASTVEMTEESENSQETSKDDDHDTSEEDKSETKD